MLICIIVLNVVLPCLKLLVLLLAPFVKVVPLLDASDSNAIHTHTHMYIFTKQLVILSHVLKQLCSLLLVLSCLEL
jgi:hypothetical protein